MSTYIDPLATASRRAHAAPAVRNEVARLEAGIRHRHPDLTDTQARDLAWSRV